MVKKRTHGEIDNLLRHSYGQIDINVLYYKNLQDLENMGMYPQGTINKMAVQIEGTKALFQEAIDKGIAKYSKDIQATTNKVVDKCLQNLGATCENGKYHIFIPNSIAPELDKTISLDFEVECVIKVKLNYDKL